MLRILWKNVQWGVVWGLGTAAFLTLVAAPFSVARWLFSLDSASARGLPFLRILIVYLIGALAGGALLGAMRPILRWWAGRRTVGMLVGIPVAFSVRLVVYGPDGWSSMEVEKWLVTGLIWGFVMSFGPENWSRDADRELRREGVIPTDPD